MPAALKASSTSSKEGIEDKSDLIEGASIKHLKAIKDDRGFLMEMLRCDDPIFKKFGQSYLTVCNPGYVKGWHFHKKQIDNFVVVKGNLRVLLYDGRPDSKTKGNSMEVFAGEKNPVLVSIPNGVYHGFENLEKEPGYVINCSSEPYNREKPDEFRTDPFDNDIPVKWKNKKGH